jgi:sterol desaturase/sphingolipid hydroxylase (fatty acid hydroxylase superfamily)
MHPLEAILLGSVMFLVMPLVTLSLATLLLFPMGSLALNNLGHLGYDLAPGRSAWHPLSSSRRHALHHSRVTVNYGFLLPALDRLFRTEPLTGPEGTPPAGRPPRP